MSRLFLMLLVVVAINANELRPHCTIVFKKSILLPYYKYTYPVLYIKGQEKVFQQLHCRGVGYEETKACDLAAPPVVRFFSGSEFLTITRQDPSGRFFGTAEVHTVQYCSTFLHFDPNNKTLPVVTKILVGGSPRNN